MGGVGKGRGEKSGHEKGQHDFESNQKPRAVVGFCTWVVASRGQKDLLLGWTWGARKASSERLQGECLRLPKQQ